MSSDSENLHGNAPDESSVVLVLIDVINDLEFPGGDELLRHAQPMAEKLSALKRKAREAKIPVIYVNDNFGKWRSDFKKLLAHCLDDDTRGKPIVELLKPEDDVYFVLKPKHSGFFSTTLDTLLQYLKVKTLILTGLTADICVLFTANDAYMRDFKLIIPSDCVASIDSKENEHALEQMKRVLKADITESTELDFNALKRQSDSVNEDAPVEQGQAHRFARGKD